MPLVAVAFSAACAFGAARASRVPTSQPTDVASHGTTASEPQPPDEPATQEPVATRQWAQPLPLPADDWTWLQEWLDLVALPSGKAATGC